MSDTPRTDAIDNARVAQGTPQYHAMLDLSRQLERELAATTLRLSETQRQLDLVRANPLMAIQAVEEECAAKLRQAGRIVDASMDYAGQLKARLEKIRECADFPNEPGADMLPDLMGRLESIWHIADEGATPKKVMEPIVDTPVYKGDAPQMVRQSTPDIYAQVEALIAAIPTQEALFAAYGMPAVDAYNALWQTITTRNSGAAPCAKTATGTSQTFSPLERFACAVLDGRSVDGAAEWMGLVKNGRFAPGTLKLMQVFRREGGIDAPPAQVVAPMWACPGCGAFNESLRSHCRKCSGEQTK